MEIKKTNDVKPTSINVLIYGASGSGKTTLAGTLQGKTLIVSLESGLLSLKGKDIDYVNIQGKTGVEKIQHLRSLLGEIEKSDYDNIFFDSLSEISQAFTEFAKREYPDDKQTMKMYGYVLDLTTKFIKYVRDMNKNCFFTALDKSSQDEVGRRFHLPDLVGSISSKAASYFDFCFYLKVFEKDSVKTRALLTDTKEGYLAKDRSGLLDEYEKPDLGLIINKVFKKG